MPTLSLGKYDLTYNALSFTMAAMGAAFVFFLVLRSMEHRSVLRLRDKKIDPASLNSGCRVDFQMSPY